MQQEVDQVERNRTAAAERFGLDPYGRRVLALYDQLLRCACSGNVDALPPETLVSKFLAPERINLLRT